MSLPTLQEIHKDNGEIFGTRHDYLLKHITTKNGISSDLRPTAIILGSPNSDYNKVKITFEAYAQVYIGTTNSTKQITVEVITLRPENEWGGYYFMSLFIGK